MSTRLVIVGGSDAGISAGLRAKELDPGCEATIVVADRFPNYSICGLPFYLSGEVRDWRALAHRTIEELNDLDLSYTPPLSSPWDPVQVSAQIWVSARERR
jgi:NADPH-dependent 2,4-dienoyl-CoA reductase/sulfur reductase-like enzyme